MSAGFDYIIVGAGSAGCVLANRLSADPHVKVLLIEAGGSDNHPLIKIPAAFYRLYKSRVDYGFYTLPQAGADNRQLFVPRGKTLGGSGSINAMIYIRGHRQDYDDWAAAGNPGWDYDSVLPYFKKSERNHAFSDAYHGTDGAWHISALKSAHPLTGKYLEAGAAVGLPVLADLNGAADEGLGLHQVNQHQARRHSPAHAFLHPILYRENLSLMRAAHVNKLLLEGNRVVGVEVHQKRSTKCLYAHKEVIVSAGSIHSPLLLLRSGIGAAAALTAQHITVRHDLPGVGQNLQDHPVAPLVYRTHRGNSLDTAENLPNLLRWLFANKGPFSSNLAEGGGFFRTQPELTAPDIQLHFAPAFFVDHGFSRPSGNGFSLAPILLRPESRGSVQLHPTQHHVPLIDPQVFAEEADLERLCDGYARALTICEAEPLAREATARFQPAEAFKSRADMRAFIRKNVELLYHPVGTCKMGAGADAVVDHQLRVHGLEGVRVADASIMPRITGGNTQAPTIMIAEKAADMILQAAAGH